jgi:hypothetical protein
MVHSEVNWVCEEQSRSKRLGNEPGTAFPRLLHHKARYLSATSNLGGLATQALGLVSLVSFRFNRRGPGARGVNNLQKVSKWRWGPVSHSRPRSGRPRSGPKRCRSIRFTVYASCIRAATSIGSVPTGSSVVVHLSAGQVYVVRNFHLAFCAGKGTTTGLD